MKNILIILGDLQLCNGISTYMMNYYKYFTLNKIHIDFVLVKGTACNEYRKLIEKRGGKIFEIGSPHFKSMKNDLNNVKNVIESGNYDIVHSHKINVGYFYLKYAKKYRINTRIIHSHTELLREKNLFREIRNRIFIKLVNNVSNVRFACSKVAGEFLFKNKEFTCIKNAIDTEKYSFNGNVRLEYRKKLNLNKNEYVICHVGRFDEQKNHKYVIDIFNNIYSTEKNAKLLLVGEGKLEENIKKYVADLNLKDRVIFLGVRNDVNKILQAVDIFILPSLFEGLPLVAIEAKAAGLPCIISSAVSKETKVTDDVVFIGIKKEDLREWKNSILNYKNMKRKNTTMQIQQAGYDIKEEAKILENLYETL